MSREPRAERCTGKADVCVTIPSPGCLASASWGDSWRSPSPIPFLIPRAPGETRTERQTEGRPDPAFRRKTSGKNDLQDRRTSQQRYLPPMPFTSAGNACLPAPRATETAVFKSNDTTLEGIQTGADSLMQTLGHICLKKDALSFLPRPQPRPGSQRGDCPQGSVRRLCVPRREPLSLETVPPPGCLCLSSRWDGLGA